MSRIMKRLFGWSSKKKETERATDETESIINTYMSGSKGKGDCEGAEPLYRNAPEASERVLGQEHPNTLNNVNNLAVILHRKGDYKGAEPLYCRALEASERVLGQEHPDTLISVNNLAVLLKSKGDYEGAEPLYRRALEASERVLGQEHPDTLNSMNSLAALLFSKGDYKGAEQLYRRAVKGIIIVSRKMGGPHPRKNNLVNNYVGCLQKMGMNEKQIKQKLEAVLIETD